MARLAPDEVARLMTVGEVAARSGVAVSALHFYESKHLIASIRSEGNQRRYPRAVLRRVALIKVAQRTGMSLDDIRAALATLPLHGAVSDADWKRLSARWRSDLETRIQRLTALRDQLCECIGCGCLSMQACPLRNPLDRLSEEGPGARLLDPE